MGFFSRLLGGNTFTCPYCFVEYDKDDIQYYCPDCGEASKPGKGEHSGMVSINCPHCGRKATVRVCPNCGSYNHTNPKASRGIIPNSSLDTDGNLPLCIIGGSSSGKTNYITVMLDELERLPGRVLSVSGVNQYAVKTQRDNRKRIYTDKQPPDATRRLVVGETLEPQLWEMKNLSRQTSRRTPTYTFTIYDGAGEDHQEHTTPTSTVCAYIKSSNAIIVTIDPLILDSLQRDIPDAARNASGYDASATKWTAADSVKSLAAYIKAGRGIRTSANLDIPVAIVLTKFDIVLALDSLPSNALVRKESTVMRNGRVNLTEIDQVSTEIENWLTDIGENAFLNALQSEFMTYKFFAVSSYGSTPTQRGKVSDRIRPHRVLDPVMWLFKQEKFLD